MTSLELNIFSPSEIKFVKSVLKNPDESFQEIVSLLERKVMKHDERIQESADKYHSLITVLSNIGFGIDIVSKDHKILYENKVLKERFGNIIGEDCYIKYIGKDIPSVFCQMEDSIKFNEIKRNELKAVDNRIYEIISAPYPNPDGTIDKVFEVIIDITEKKKAEQKLKESEEKYRTIVDNILDIIYEIELDGKITYLSPQTIDMLGYEPNELVNRNTFRFLHPDDHPKVLETLNYVIKSSYFRSLEFRIRHKAGYYVPVSSRGQLIERDGNKKLIGLLRDVTEQKNAEKELKESEENFRTIAEDSHLAITILQGDLVVYTNQKMADMFGYDREEMLKWTPKEYAKTIGEDSLEFVLEQARKKQLGDPDVISHYPIHAVRSTGEKFWVDNISTTINYNGCPADLVTLIDITDIREAEQKLKESEEKFRTLTEQSFLGITILQNNIVKYVNKQLADIFGYEVEEVMNWGPGGFINVIHPDDRQMVVEQATKKQLGKSDAVIQYEFRGIKKNGDMIWLELFSKTINYKGELADFATIHDITDKKISEQKLIESEEKFRKITEESLLAICTVQDNVIKYVNHEMATLYGYKEEEMYNWGPGELLKTVAPDSLELVKEQLRKKQAGDLDVINHYPLQILRKNGEVFWVDNLSKTMMYEGKPADLVTQVDITERIKAQQELVKLNQLKSELLRRTSHELKTPLVSIKGFTELLLEVHRDKLDTLIISTLNEIKQGCVRLETLIGDILKTAELESGTTQLQKSEEDLGFLVKVCVNEIKGFSKLRNHTIHLELHEKLRTQFEKEQIHQVISNLLNNAVKYTPSSGLIDVKSEIKEEFIILSIKDNGIGFTEEEKTRIFKQFGKIERYGQGLDVIPEGSGFGLFISKKIIDLHGGDIWVESEGRNMGSTFYFSLPLI